MGSAHLILIFIGMCWLSACGDSSSAATSQSVASQQPDAIATFGAGQAMTTPAPHAEVATSKPPKQATLRKSFTDCMDHSDGVTVNMMNCMGNEIPYQDSRLNNAYKRLHKAMPADKWIALRDEQRKWLNNEGQDCQPDSDSGEATSGTAGILNYKMCALNRLAVRADELESMLKNQR